MIQGAMAEGERGGTSILMTAHVADAIVSHARAEAPMECCGLLLGSGNAIDECVPTANVRNSATAYQVDPAAHFAVIRRVRQEGRRILGAYHSHPRSAARPSAADIAEAHDADLVYVIVSLEDSAAPDLRAYGIREGVWQEHPLCVVRRGDEPPTAAGAVT